MINETRTYVILGDPVALARARFARGRFYDSQKEFKLIAGCNLRNQHDTDQLFEGPLYIFVRFFMPRSKSKKKALIQWHHTKPDIDNLLKYLLDTCNTILFKDDACIASLNSIKIYDDKPRTEFTIHQLEKR